MREWAKVFVVLVLAVAIIGCSTTPKQLKTTGEQVTAPIGCLLLRERGYEC